MTDTCRPEARSEDEKWEWEVEAGGRPPREQALVDFSKTLRFLEPYNRRANLPGNGSNARPRRREVVKDRDGRKEVRCGRCAGELLWIGL